MSLSVRSDVLFHIGSELISQWVPNFTVVGFEKVNKQ